MGEVKDMKERLIKLVGKEVCIFQGLCRIIGILENNGEWFGIHHKNAKVEFTAVNVIKIVQDTIILE